MAMFDRKYKPNQTLLKVYGEGINRKIKLITMKGLRTEGIEEEECEVSDRGTNDFKLCNNISRAKSKVFELAYCNEWEYFFTGTLDKSKYDRKDLEKFHKDITSWIRSYNRYHGTDIKYLLVPELHEDGESWHMHGFLANLPVELLHQFEIGDRMGKYIANKVRNGEIVYNWPAYAKKFGFCDLEPIKSHEAVCKYVSKYINKNLGKCVSEVGAHLYYHSRGLKTASLWAHGFSDYKFTPDYENDYCKVAWLPYDEKLFEDLLCSFIEYIPVDGDGEFEEI